MGIRWIISLPLTAAAMAAFTAACSGGALPTQVPTQMPAPQATATAPPTAPPEKPSPTPFPTLTPTPRSAATPLSVPTPTPASMEQLLLYEPVCGSEPNPHEVGLKMNGELRWKNSAAAADLVQRLVMAGFPATIYDFKCYPAEVPPVIDEKYGQVIFVLRHERANPAMLAFQDVRNGNLVVAFAHAGHLKGVQLAYDVQSPNDASNDYIVVAGLSHRPDWITTAEANTKAKVAYVPSIAVFQRQGSSGVQLLAYNPVVLEEGQPLGLEVSAGATVKDVTLQLTLRYGSQAEEMKHLTLETALRDLRGKPLFAQPPRSG